MHHFKNSVLSEILKCWKCEILFTFCYKWFTRQASKSAIYKPCFKVPVIYSRGLFSDKKTKLIYSNGLSQVHLSSPFSNGGNRKA